MARELPPGDMQPDDAAPRRTPEPHLPGPADPEGQHREGGEVDPALAMPENEARAARRGRGCAFTLLPLLLFGALAVIMLMRLGQGGASNDLPSALIGQPVPTLALGALDGLSKDGGPVPGFDTAALGGRVAIVNVFASWCVPCRQEHPLLMQLAAQGKDGGFTLAGLNYKDKPENALAFLGALGNPYAMVGVDPNGRAAIEWGVYGVPETFVVDRQGRIVHKLVGPLTPERMAGLMAAIGEAGGRPVAALATPQDGAR